mgnify:CR=1 FL=1
MRDLLDQKPISAAFRGGSVTTYTGKNPSYQVLTLDSATMLPLEMETYKFDILKANADDKDAVWELDHKTTELFDLPDLSPNSMMILAEQAYAN